MENNVQKIKTRKEHQIKCKYLLRQKHPRYHIYKRIRKALRNLMEMIRRKQYDQVQVQNHKDHFNKEITELKQLEPERWINIHLVDDKDDNEINKKTYKDILKIFKIKKQEISRALEKET